MLKSLLYADLERQLELSGQPRATASLTRFLRRLLHPRFLPVVLCRCSRAALLNGIPALAHLLSYLNQILFGIEISPRCVIGPGIFFPHTSGTVIGASKIGRDVTIFQGVTLGARQIDMSYDLSLRPELGDCVVVGAGAKVLGGICLGDNVKVGANSVLLRSVPANTTVAGIPAREIHSSDIELPEVSKD
ncbi:MAG: serine O-acetyltransferase [Acidobacteriaceae bacterium]|jgi:serine O-acetyltransferase|nr:serine O-acetyltransferase [Acidobacteriaceae bacterium]